MNEQAIEISYEAMSVVFKHNDQANDIYKIISGKLLVCITNGKKVTPIAYINKGEYIGEMSFFDNKPRSAHVIALEECRIVKIPHHYLKAQFPKWLLKTAQFMSEKLRIQDEVLNEKGLKKKKNISIEPLSIELERQIVSILEL